MWLSALLVIIVFGVLWATGVVGSWVVLISNGMAIVGDLMGYRAEAAGAMRRDRSREELP